MSRADLLGSAGLVAAACVFFGVDVIWSGTKDVAFPNVDLFTEFIPRHAFAAAAVRRGEIPLWDAHQIAGLPFLATWQAGVFYPPNVVYAVLPVGWAMGLLALLHLIGAGVLTFAVARLLGGSHAASALAGLTFMLGGSTVSLIYHTNAISSAPWLPAAVYCAWRLSTDPRLRWALVLGLVLALQCLAGRDYTLVMTLHAVALLGLLQVGWMARDAVGPGRIGRYVGALALAAALAVGIASVQLFPTLDLAAQSQRTFEGLWGPFVEVYGPLPPAFAFANLVNPVRGAVRREYLGWIPLVCFVIGFRLWGRDRPARFASLLTLLALVLAFGSQTPLYMAYRSLPLGATFRLPDRFLFLFAFGFALVAASGFDRVFAAARSGAAGRRPRAAIAVPVLCLGAALFLALDSAWMAEGLRRAAEPWRWFTFYGFDRGHFSSLGRARWYFLVVAVLVALGRQLAASPAGTAVRVAALLLAAGDLTYALASRALHPVRDAGPALAGAPCYAQAAAITGPLGRHLSIRARDSWVLKDKDGELFGGHAATHYDPLVTRRQATYFAALQQGGTDIVATPWTESSRFMGFLTRYPAADRLVLLDLLGVNALLVDAADAETPALRSLLSRMERVARCPVTGGGRPLTVELYRNGHAFPRAFVVHRTESVPNAEVASSRLAEPGFDPRREATVESGRPLLGADDDGATDDRVEIASYAARQVTIRVETRRPGLLVLTDSYDEDWRATRNGQSTEVHPTDGLFRGVQVPTGASTVEFRYDPASFRWGVVASVATLALWGVLWVVGARSPAP